MNITSIMIVGVGGQGTLLASRLIGNLFINEGMDVKVSEVHGMSQRGGSVVTYVKCGDKVDSPIIDKGEADFIIAFEELEAYRWLPYLKNDGKLITSTQKISPMPVITGAAKYPENIIETIKSKDIEVIALDAEKLAIEAGNVKTVNIVLMGVLSKYLNISEDKWQKALESTVPAKVLDVNKKAFSITNA